MARQARSRSRARRRAGFTLLEMMLALVILAGGLLAMLSVQVQALKQGRFGRHTSEAMQIARDQMELLMRLPWDAPGAQPTAWTAPAPIDVTVQSDGGAVVQQTFNVSWRISAAGFEPNARMVDIDVTWTESDVNAGFERRYVLSSVKNNES
jgi:prepilin-type N-terminal cleavage/methylation domain-containing protein